MDQTNSMGVPVDDHELNDPGTDNDAPDPLLGEQASSGALAKAAPSLASARRNAADRYSENEDEMTSLRSQYANTSKQQSDAYAEQKRQLDLATQRLMGMQSGPTDQEKLYRIGAAGMTPGLNGVNIGGINQAQADILKERREAELQKQALIAQYATQAPQAVIGQTNAKLNQITQQQRIVAGQLNSAGNQQFRGQSQLPWYVKANDDGTYALQPGADKVMDAQAMSKLFGRFTLLPQPDGSKKIVMLGNVAGGSPAASAPPVAPSIQRPAAAPPAAPGAAPAAPAKPNAQLPNPYEDLFLPSTVLDSKYGALTPATKPAYVATATQAFDPAYFSEYKFAPHNFGDMDIRKKQIESEGKELGDSGAAAQQMIYNYGSALSAMDKLDDPTLRTGPASVKISKMENALRGVLPDSVIRSMFDDADLAKLGTGQETDKYFLNAATTGLKAIYGGRITNQEVTQRVASLPSNNLLPAVTRMLAAAQAEVAQDTVNKSKLFGTYVRKGGDPSPTTFNTWYEANFSPFHQSRLKTNLGTQQTLAAGKESQTANPLVAYYVALSKWKAAGSVGPAPAKPQ